MKQHYVLDYVGPDRDGDIVFSDDRDLSVALSLAKHAEMGMPRRVIVTMEAS